MKLSVIVPVYNVEKFLPRCLDSLLRQGMQPGEWEVICVNDGSPDGCAAILADYAERHPDVFRIITQENQGLGAARNTGTDQAQGEWVTYLDSDDYLVDGAYRYLIDRFCSEDTDVLCYGFRHVYTDGRALHDPQAKPDGEVTFEGDGMDAYNQWALPFVWSKCYRRSFIEAHEVRSHVVACQDEVFNFDVFRHHPHTRIVSSTPCRYELGNANSIQQTSDQQKVLRTMDDMFRNSDYLLSFLDEEHADLRPAVMRGVNNFLNVYHKKLLMAFIPWRQWNNFRHRMQALPAFNPVLEGDGRSARWLTRTKKWAGQSYVFYALLYFVRNVVFQRCLKPMLFRQDKA